MSPLPRHGPCLNGPIRLLCPPLHIKLKWIYFGTLKALKSICVAYIYRELLFSKVWAVKSYLQKKVFFLQNWRTYWLLILDFRLRCDWHYIMIIHASSYFLRVGICLLFLYFVSVFLYLIQSLENSWLEIWLWILCTSVYFNGGAHRSTEDVSRASTRGNYLFQEPRKKGIKWLCDDKYQYPVYYD